ncbi:hypothetical protein, partial [Coprococcus comes]
IKFSMFFNLALTFYLQAFSAVLQQSFRFAVFARFVTFQVLYIAWLDLIPSVLSRTALRRIGFALFLDITWKQK